MTSTFGRYLECSYPNCPYATEEMGKIIGHLHKRNEIPRKDNLSRPNFPPHFSKITALTRHLYGISLPDLKEKGGTITQYGQVWKDDASAKNNNKFKIDIDDFAN